MKRCCFWAIALIIMGFGSACHRGLNHIYENNGEDETEMAYKGDIRFNDSETAIERISPGGYLTQRVDAGAILGLRHDAASIRGGDTEHNVAVTRRFLDGQPGPVFDVVCANAALALIVASRVTTLSEGFEMASASVRDGRARHALERLVELSNS